jgi:hypothetical protein
MLAMTSSSDAIGAMSVDASCPVREYVTSGMSVTYSPSDAAAGAAGAGVDAWPQAKSKEAKTAD